MPVEQDPFSNIVNVQWGEEGVFVGGDRFGNIYYLGSSTDGAIVTVTKPFSEMAYLGSAYALVGGEPVFVLVGDYVRGSGSEFSDRGTAIVASHDGKSWSMALDEQNEFIGSDPPEPGDKFTERDFNGVVYDPEGREDDDPPQAKGRFYAVAYTIEFKWPHDDGAQPGDRMEGNILYSSRDGFSWSEVGRRMVDTTFGDLPLTTPSLIKPHCTAPKNAGDIPDGFQGYDDGTWIYPPLLDPGFNVFGIRYKTFPPSSNVKISKPGDAPKDSAVSMPCYAVAQVGGTWLAAGGSSADDGSAAIDMATGADGEWTNIFKQTGKGPIATMTAGSLGS